MATRPKVPGAASQLGFKNNLQGSTSVQFDFKPSVGIMAAKVDKLGLDIRSFREPLKRAVKEVMIPSIMENFEVEGRPAWEPLSSNTLKTRAALGWSGGGILLLTGTLRSVATQQSIWTITEKSATVRDLPQRAWYGKVHQAGQGGGVSSIAAQGKRVKVGGVIRFVGSKGGDERGGNGIPPRRFIMIQDEDRDAITDVFEEWLGERVDRVWGKV